MPSPDSRQVGGLREHPGTETRGAPDGCGGRPSDHTTHPASHPPIGTLLTLFRCLQDGVHITAGRKRDSPWVLRLPPMSPTRSSTSSLAARGGGG
jgi:hypothetical protein